MEIRVVALTGIPRVQPGDDLAEMMCAAIERLGVELRADDVLVVCQKIVSKAEGRVVTLSEVVASERALGFAHEFGKEPAVVELALREAREVLRMTGGHLITATGPGFICANSGLDRSNQNGPDEATLLPADADASAARLRAGIAQRLVVAPAVIVSDTFGRPWRLGQIDFAIGAAGLAVLDDHAGRTDWSGRTLEHTVIALADQLSAAAGLVMAKDGGVPACLVRGCEVRAPRPGAARAADLVRPSADDLFR